MKNKKTLQKVLLHAVLIIASLLIIYPVFIMLSNSFKHLPEIYSNSSGLPINPTVDNYIRLFTYNSGIILRTYFNSIFIAATSTMLTLIVASMAGFAFAKHKFKGKKVLFLALLLTMMIPHELLITPQFLIYAKINWLNTYKVQIIPSVANVFSMFLFRQYMLSIPDEMIEATRIDGAGHLKVFTKIIIPTAAPAFGALGILQFLAKWNDYLYPRIMITKVKLKPIMVILPTLSENDSAGGAIPYDLMLAGCAIVIVPMMIVFLLLQDKFLDSVTIGSVKG